MRGGMGYSAQGTGITSGMDTPRPRYYGGGTIGGGTIMGNMMGNRTGFQNPNLKDVITTSSYFDEQKGKIAEGEEEIVKTPEGQNMYDVISSFGVYANMKNPDGSYKTTGEAGFEQAENIAKIRKDRKDLQDAAKLKELEDKRASINKQEQQVFELDKIMKKGNIDTKLQYIDQDTKIKVAEITKKNSVTSDRLEQNNKMLELELEEAGDDQTKIDAAKRKHKKNIDDIISGSNLEAQALKIAGEIVRASGGMKSIEEVMTDLIVLITAIKAQNFSTGGRVGYQMGTPATGAMPVATETVMEEQTVAEDPQQASVPLPYSEFRAKIPAEVSDEIVQLIYYNQNAFADFAQITTQADVYAFNNKYGVSLVLPMQTEMT